MSLSTCCHLVICYFGCSLGIRGRISAGLAFSAELSGSLEPNPDDRRTLHSSASIRFASDQLLGVAVVVGGHECFFNNVLFKSSFKHRAFFSDFPFEHVGQPFELHGSLNN